MDEGLHTTMLRDQLRRSVTVQQLDALEALATCSGCRVSVLARALGVATNAAHNRVNTLAARGFVELRRPAMTVHLTAQGRVVVALLE